MKSGGFPCRYGGCDVRFSVIEQGSMPALLAASAQRTEHELATHEYTHPAPPENAPRPAYGARSAPRQRAR